MAKLVTTRFNSTLSPIRVFAQAFFNHRSRWRCIQTTAQWLKNHPNLPSAVVASQLNVEVAPLYRSGIKVGWTKYIQSQDVPQLDLWIMHIMEKWGTILLKKGSFFESRPRILEIFWFNEETENPISEHQHGMVRWKGSTLYANICNHGHVMGRMVHGDAIRFKPSEHFSKTRGETYTFCELCRRSPKQEALWSYR